MKDKYYVICTTAKGIKYKKYKCIEGWSNSKNDCWQFTKQGAETIAKRYNDKNKDLKIHYNTLKVQSN